LKRPVLWLAVFLVCGIVLRAYASLPLLALGFGLGLFLCVLLYRVYRYWPVFIFLVFLTAGAWRVGHSLHSHTEYPAFHEFHGVVLDAGITAGGNQRVVVRGMHPESGQRVRVMAYIEPHLRWASLGQEIELTGELLPLTTPRNPGAYNQFMHLRPQKIDATMWPETVSLGDVRPRPMVFLRQFRDRLAHVYEQVLPPREAGIIKSMVLGDRTGMDWDLAELYRTMGIFHILSISGLHVTILMMAANKLLGIFLPQRRAGIVVLVIMVLYCLLTGAAIATVRAVLMGGVMIFGKILYREYDLLTSLSWAMVVLLLYEPLQIFNAGFQLSFGAVYGIGILTQPLERLLITLRTPKWGGLRNSLAVGIAAVISTYIVFAYHFYEIPLYSVLGNLVIMPTTTVLLVMGVVVGLVGLVWPGGAMVASGTVYYVLRFYEIAAHVFSSLPFAMILTGGGSLLVAGLGVLVLAAFAFMFHGYGDDFRRRGVLLVLATVVLVSVVFVRATPMDMHVTVLDTWGNYTVIRHRGDVLATGRARGGERVLLNYLDKRGVTRANGLILTEPPRPQDVERLAQLAPRFNVLYISGEMAGATASLANQALEELAAMASEQGFSMPQIVFLNHGDIRQSGRMYASIETGEMGRLGAHIKFGEMAVNIEITSRDAHVDIVDSVVETFEWVHPTREYGAVVMRVGAGRVVFR